MDRGGEVAGVMSAPIRLPRIRQEVLAMEGTRYPSERMMKVQRSFEWSRLESQLMTSAYEHVLPVVQSAAGIPFYVKHEPETKALGKSEPGRPCYATGA